MEAICFGFKVLYTMIKIQFKKVKIGQQFNINGLDYPLVRVGALIGLCKTTNKRHVIYPMEQVKVHKEVKK